MKITKKQKVLVISCLFIFIAAGIIFYPKNSAHILKINGEAVKVEIADNAALRARGLCCRNQIDENSGMLFIYDKPGDYKFWMKDTKIPLDIIWIDEQKKIVHIEHSVQPETYPKSFGSKSPARYVFEVNAGYAKKHNIKVGDKASF
jgi:uncharacterized protein